MTEEDSVVGRINASISRVLANLATQNWDSWTLTPRLFLGRPVPVMPPQSQLNSKSPRPPVHVPVSLIPGVKRSRRVYKCDICGRPFMHKSAYDAHQPTHLNATELAASNYFYITCAKCGRVFFHTRKYKYHMSNHARREDTIRKRKKLVRERSAARMAAGKVPNQKFKPKPTPKPTPPPQPDIPAQCNICDKKFPSMNELGEHLKEHVAQEENSLKCPDCSKSFPSPTVLLRHRKVAHPKKLKLKVKTITKGLGCGACNLKFKTRSELVRHTVLVHKNNSADNNKQQPKPTKGSSTKV